MVSLVTTLSCAFANQALANRESAEITVRDAQLPSRVAAAVERIRLLEPSLTRDITRDSKMAWSN
jgi:hypothetical protein